MRPSTPFRPRTNSTRTARSTAAKLVRGIGVAQLAVWSSSRARSSRSCLRSSPVRSSTRSRGIGDAGTLQAGHARHLPSVHVAAEQPRGRACGGCAGRLGTPPRPSSTSRPDRSPALGPACAKVFSVVAGERGRGRRRPHPSRTQFPCRQASGLQDAFQGRVDRLVEPVESRHISSRPIWPGSLRAPSSQGRRSACCSGGRRRVR
jgi:hypothetical protein